MKITELTAKLLKGEELTEEEKKFLGEYDPDKAANEAAAAARRKAEADAKKLADELEALKAEKAKAAEEAEKERQKGMTEAQKLAAQIEQLTKSVEEVTKAKAESDKQAAAMARKQKIAQIREANKIAFVDGVDPDLAGGAFEAAFEGLETLDDETAVKERLTAFQTKNKALILDASGHGSGQDGRPVSMGLNGKAVDQMTAAERKQDLQKRGVI